MARTQSTRDQLIVAGLELNDELPLSRLFAGTSTSAVAERAGVTTGSYFHHFRDATAFADALVRSYVRERPLGDEARRRLADASERGNVAEALSDVLVEIWTHLTTDPTETADRRGQMHLFAHHRAVLDLTPRPDDSRPADGQPIGSEPITVGDVLRDVFRPQIEGMETTWRQVFAMTKMRLTEPFDARRLAVAVYALMVGLEIVHAVDPAGVDDRLFADTTAAIAGTVARVDLRPPRVTTASELGEETDASPQARSGARRRETNRRRIVAATTGMFDHGWDHVSLRDVAEVAGMSTQTVINLFGSVRMVCAATFGHHIDRMQEVIDAAMTDRPFDALRDALTVVATAAAIDPDPARAFLVERLGVRLASEFELSDDDVRVIVPYGLRMAPVVGALTAREPADPDNADLVATLLDTVLAHAIPRPGRADESVELALRLLPVP